MKTTFIILFLIIFPTILFAKDYVIRFEGGNRIASIACDNIEDMNNKVKQSQIWADSDENRRVVVSSDNRADIKLVNGKIQPLSQEEIDAKKPKIKTAKDDMLELLKDVDIQNVIKGIK